MGIEQFGTRCQVQQRISKATVLAMLGSPVQKGPYVGQTVQYVKPNGMTANYRVDFVGRDSVHISNIKESLVVPTSSIKLSGQPLFLDKLQNEEWTITAFNPHTRIVCIQIKNGSITENMTVTLPVIDQSKNKSADYGSGRTSGKYFVNSVAFSA